MNITEFQFHILVSLAKSGASGLHGYGILQSIMETTKGLRKYALPSLYEALNTLLTRGLVAIDRQEPEAGRLRKYFRLTSVGRRSMRQYYDETEVIRKSIAMHLRGNSA